MAQNALTCPNCGTAWPPGAAACPHCGYLQPPPAWPPPPSGFVAPPPPPAPRLVTGKPWGDVTLGLGLSFASNFLACAGFVVMPILYFTLKPTYPLFTRGIGYGTLAGLVLLLGAVVWCFAGLAGYHGG